MRSVPKSNVLAQLTCVVIFLTKALEGVVRMIWPQGYIFSMLNSTEHEIKTTIPTNKEVYGFKSLRFCIYHSNKCLNAICCWYFNIYEQDKFRAQLS